MKKERWLIITQCSDAGDEINNIVGFYGTALEARQFLFDMLNEDAKRIKQNILYGPSSPKEIRYENREFSTYLNYSDFFVNYFAKRISSLDWYEQSEETKND